MPLVLLEVEQLTFIALETSPGKHQVKEFLDSLDDVGHRDWRSSTRVLATSLATGRSTAGRAERVAGSSEKLFELRVTPRGRRGPQARILYVREANTILCARGLLKR